MQPDATLTQATQKAEDALDREQFIHGADTRIDPHADPEFPAEFITGSAGTGKTYGLKKAIEADPSFGWLCATTGIAAVNLNTVTINSMLRYYNTQSLEDAYISRRLHNRLLKLAILRKRLVVDEVSMMAAAQLDTLYKALQEINGIEFKDELGTQVVSLGLTITGDFCQLPPVKEKWAFEADCWPVFDRNTTLLTKIWRQDDPQFMQAMGFLRAGDGINGVQALKACGVPFKPALDTNFDGTTIMATNKKVDGFNNVRLAKLEGEQIVVPSYRWGREASEWSYIPQNLVMKPGALAMILANESMTYEYANGDLCHILDWMGGGFVVRVQRNQLEKSITYIQRANTNPNPPKAGAKPEDYPQWPSVIEDVNEYTGDSYQKPNPEPPPWDPPEGAYYIPNEGVYAVGGIRYIPLRLGWASTVHKSQGLTLDNVQVDPRERFFGNPGMAYVALSRARRPDGLCIVADERTFAQRVAIDPKVKRWA